MKALFGDKDNRRPGEIDASILDDILNDLTELSADEWNRVLEEPDVADGPDQEDGREFVDQPESTDAPEPTVYTITDIYGQVPDDDDALFEDETALSAPDEPEWGAQPEPDEPAPSPISGVVKDELSLKLMQLDIVNTTQLFDAIRLREEGEALWRALCRLESTPSARIAEEAARFFGFRIEADLGERPERAFIDDLFSRVDTADAARLIRAGLLPLEMQQGQLIVASADPTAPGVEAALLSFPVSTECVFVPAEQLSAALDRVRLRLSFEDAAGQDAYAAEEAEPDSAPASAVQAEADQPEADPSAADKPPVDVPAPPPPKPVTQSEVEKTIARDRVVKRLMADGMVDDAAVREAVAVHKSEGGRDALWRVLAEIKTVSREMVYGKAAAVYAFKEEELTEGRPDADFVKLTMETLAEEHREEMLEMLLVPFEHELDMETGAGRIIFVTPDPTRPEVNKLLHALDVGRFELRYVPESQVIKLLDELFPRKNEYLERITKETEAFDLGMTYEEEGGSDLDEDALEAEMSRSKLINLFEASLVEAVRAGASDIHMYPNQNRQVEIHFRTDGRLKKWHTEDKVHPEAFLAVVKDNATNVDRFERDMAQDGFIQRDIDGALIRFRVSILPIATANQEVRAESIVIRILDDRKVLTDIRKLGMLDVALERFNKAIRQPHGMVILTGPTGSGKSTTLVAALHQVVTPEVNVLTVEDPVEYIIKGVRQIKLSHKLDLEGALRAILRHDPDVVMVGEMRDRATAELAIKLANTGHLTFSTLHTNDAPAAVSRLYKMGIEPFLIAYAINLVVAQRLIREVCSECRIEDANPDRVLLRNLGFTEEELDSTTFYKAGCNTSCSRCGGSGYKGRRAVCETLYFSQGIRHLIAESGNAIDEDAIRELAIEEGVLTLGDSARELMKLGLTTAEEMIRMTAT